MILHIFEKLKPYTSEISLIGLGIVITLISAYFVWRPIIDANGVPSFRVTINNVPTPPPVVIAEEILPLSSISNLSINVGDLNIGSLVDNVRTSLEAQLAIYRFDNMSRDDMIYDFEYLMTVLEENWPFFNLSISANDVDVRELADNMRALLNNPATEINTPIDLLYLMHEYFFYPIGWLGHLSLYRNYVSFFEDLELIKQTVQDGIANSITLSRYERNTRPETLMFYSRLRDMGRGRSLVGVARESGPVMRFDILEEGRIAYLEINRMIHFFHDPLVDDPRGMRRYERMMYIFYNNIKGYEHLIIDLRGNTGGMLTHFSIAVMPHFLRERIYLPAYVFYMDGVYANLAREIFFTGLPFLTELDQRVHDINYGNREIFFYEPLPYLDTEIEFATAIWSGFHINPRRHYFGRLPSFGTRRSSFYMVYFTGEIWVLTDGRTASAAEGATAILKYNNIATVVGEPTWGIMGTNFEPLSAIASLPNTGILVRLDVAYYTDHYGRPLQGYIQPHYPNRPGMDALETVLAMIEERG